MQKVQSEILPKIEGLAKEEVFNHTHSHPTHTLTQTNKKHTYVHTYRHTDRHMLKNENSIKTIWSENSL